MERPLSIADVKENIQRLREDIERILGPVPRRARAREVRMVGVSKGIPADRILLAHEAGLSEFGENRYQEALPKIRQLKLYGIRWHFIGRIQRNKLQDICETFDVVQSIDRLEILEMMERILSQGGRSKELYLQVNLSGVPSRAGFNVEEAERFFESGKAADYPHCPIRGFMALGPYPADRETIRTAFRRLRLAFARCQKSYRALDTLSMGMSDDYPIALEEGSTMIRIGRGIFGARPS